MTLSHPAAQHDAYETRALLSLAKSCFTQCAMARKDVGEAPREVAAAELVQMLG